MSRRYRPTREERDDELERRAMKRWPRQKAQLRGDDWNEHDDERYAWLIIDAAMEHFDRWQAFVEAALAAGYLDERPSWLDQPEDPQLNWALRRVSDPRSLRVPSMYDEED